MATSDTVQTRPRLVIRFLETKGQVIVSPSIEKKRAYTHQLYL